MSLAEGLLDGPAVLFQLLFGRGSRHGERLSDQHDQAREGQGDECLVPRLLKSPFFGRGYADGKERGRRFFCARRTMPGLHTPLGPRGPSTASTTLRPSRTALIRAIRPAAPPRLEEAPLNLVAEISGRPCHALPILGVADKNGRAQIAEAGRQGEFVAMPMGRGEIGDVFKLFEAESFGSNQFGEKTENFCRP